MSTELVVYDDSMKSLIRKTLAKDASAEQFEMFLEVCQRTGLNPFAKQIYAVVRKGSDRYPPTMTIQVGIDGLRLIAQRTGEYEGQTAPEWCGMDGVWRDVWLESEPPAAARVGVRRRSFIDPVYGIAKYDSFVQQVDIYDGNQKTGKKRPNEMWARMADTMLAKCAESAALRKAFPQELSGLHTEVEGRAGDYVQMSGEVERPAIKKPKSKKALALAPPVNVDPDSGEIDQDVPDAKFSAVLSATLRKGASLSDEDFSAIYTEEGSVEGDLEEIPEVTPSKGRAKPAPKGPSYPEPFDYEEEQAKNAPAASSSGDGWPEFYNEVAEVLKGIKANLGDVGMALNVAGNVGGLKAWYGKNEGVKDPVGYVRDAVLKARG